MAGKVEKIMFHINSLGKGGAERVIVNLSEQLSFMGIDCVIATEWKDADEYPLDSSVRRIDVGVGADEEKYSSSRLRSVRRKLLNEAIVSEKPDALVCFCRNANYRGILAAKGTGVPVIISVRSDPKIDYASSKQKVLSGILYKKADGAVFQTEEARDFFPEGLRKKSKIILNPLNDKYINIPDVAPENRRKAIVTAGRFHEAKDQLVLIKAFERLMDDYKDVNLELYGARSEDNTYDVIMDYVNEHKLTDRVLFMGNSNELEKLIVDASVFVLSSKYEGMPNALMEAMAMKLPVVSTDCPCGGPRMLIKDGENGYLVPVGDDKAMAEAIRKHLDNPEKADAMGKEAGKIAKDARPQRIALEWLEYIESLVK